jgi:hypothetical protein
MTKTQLKAEFVTFRPVVPLSQPMTALKQSGAFIMYSLYARSVISRTATYPSQIPRVSEFVPGLRSEEPVPGALWNSGS